MEPLDAKDVGAPDGRRTERYVVLFEGRRVYVRRGFFWPLKLTVALSLAVPTLLFAYSSAHNYRTVKAQTDERIARALDILQEQALKALQTVVVSLAQTDEMLRGLDDAEIRSREKEFHGRFREAQNITGHMESIWAFDRDGRPLASSTIFPVPPTLDNSDRSYFAAQKDSAVTPFIGEVVRAKIGGARFFVVSARRSTRVAGDFNGIVAVTLPPDHFAEFYRKLSRGRDSFALLRTDGALLARYPDPRVEGALSAPRIMAAAAANPEGSLFTAMSSLDQQERRVGYRKVPGYPLYVAASVEAGAVRNEFLDALLIQLAVGLPATLALFGLSLYALHRAKRFHTEVERREVAEAALKQAQRLEALGQLTGGVAHDFNNLLMVVSGNADLLGRVGAIDARVRSVTEALRTVVQRGTALTGALLSFSRRQAHASRSLDLRHQLEALRSILLSTLRGDITLELDLPADLWPVEADVGELELALLNLTMNARDALPDGGTVTIAAQNQSLKVPNALDLHGDFVAIRVTDTGDGIPANLLPRVFEPFFTTKEVGKGTGLGLSQVYGFARQAGGTATVSSEGKGGTTVTLLLPRSQRPVDVAAPASVSKAVEARPPERNLLLVEDNQDVAATALLLLEELGYRVDHVPDVASARARLQSAGSFDLVLSDIVMPGKENGLDLARWIRRKFGDRIPVVLASGYSDQITAAKSDGFPVLRKPYGLSTLERALAQALKRNTSSAS